MIATMGRSRGPVLALVISLLAATVHAEPEADGLFEEGRKLLDTADPKQACAKFNEAIKLDPDAPGVMLNLGLCNEKLGKYRTALYWFRKAQVARRPRRTCPTTRTPRRSTRRLSPSKVATREDPVHRAAACRHEGEDRRRGDRARRLPARRGRSGRAHARRRCARQEDRSPGASTSSDAAGRAAARDAAPIAFVAGDEHRDRRSRRRRAGSSRGSARSAAAALMRVVRRAQRSTRRRPQRVLRPDSSPSRDAAPRAGCIDVRATDEPREPRRDVARTWARRSSLSARSRSAAASRCTSPRPTKERVDRTVFVPTRLARRRRVRAAAAASELARRGRAGCVGSGADVVDHAREHGVGLGALTFRGEHAAARELARARDRSRAAGDRASRRCGSMLAVEHLARARDLAGLEQRVDPHAPPAITLLSAVARPRLVERAQRVRPVAAQLVRERAIDRLRGLASRARGSVSDRRPRSRATGGALVSVRNANQNHEHEHEAARLPRRAARVPTSLVEISTEYASAIISGHDPARRERPSAPALASKDALRSRSWPQVAARSASRISSACS